MGYWLLGKLEKPIEPQLLQRGFKDYRHRRQSQATGIQSAGFSSVWFCPLHFAPGSNSSSTYRAVPWPVSKLWHAWSILSVGGCYAATRKLSSSGNGLRADR